MRPTLLATAALTTLGLLAPAVLASGVVVGPTPMSDRRFPFVEAGPAFTGTPLQMDQARLPGVTIVVDPSPQAAPQAASLALMLGQWTETTADGAPEMAAKRFRPLVRQSSELTPQNLASRHLIILGQRNPLVERLGNKVPGELGAQGPAVWVVADAFAPGKQVMILAGRNDAELSEAVAYLANERLFFKAGAYDGFFAFVRLRLYLEKGNLAAAADLLEDPRQLRGCAKPVVQMGPRLAAMPPAVGDLAKRRNQLVFGEIRAAIAQQDAKTAIARWQDTMQTCYACHQGRGGTQVRRYQPMEYPHRTHQDLAKRGGLECATCHQGTTAYVGYDAKP